MRFIARQPVFDSGLRVFGYELLFRAGMEEFARITDENRAVCTTLDNSVVWGIDRLCDGRLAFVNCTREVMTSGIVQILPPGRTVLEVLEGIDADDEVLAACRTLKRKGYLIALDDVTSIDEMKPYVGVAQLAKVDFRLTTRSEQAEMARWLNRWGMTPLAEKVETQEEYRAAVRMGFELFQGFFLQRPELIGNSEIPELRANYVRLFESLQGSELRFELVEEAIRSEPSLCFRLFRYLNSPLFGISEEIASIRHALQLLGERNIRNWILVAVASAMGEGKAPELVVWALTRARFCELTASSSKRRPDGMFVAGMLSAFPALLEARLEDILARVTVAAPIRAALLGEPGVRRDLLQLVDAYESGDWEACHELTRNCELPERTVAECYVQAVDWAEQVTGIGSATAPHESVELSLATR